ncbi:MAG TPA: hypothetical protein VFS20_26915 [Longimicrobium sp.]|nr:hypothetical protein [Longimicrobium sp.]
MKKLKLDLDHIRVSSFAVETTRGGKGTVNGYNTSNGYTAMWGACGGGESNDSCHPQICDPVPISWESNC